MKRNLKKIFFVSFGFIALLFLILAGIFVFWSRERQIDFSMLLPAQMEFCNRHITPNDSSYIALSNWFRSHKNGWKNSMATYLETHTYKSPTFYVNIFNDAVVVNFLNKNGKWEQLIRQKKPFDLPADCP